MSRKRVDLTGRRFDRLLVLECVGSDNRGRSMFRVMCDCGREKVMRSSNMLMGLSTSCGCKKRDLRNALKHGKKSTPEYAAWISLRQRCSNPDHPNYRDYGGRGIAVCERWDSFESFLSDMGERPTPAHSIDRENNDGPYSPENCRWATRSEQMRNRRPRHLWPSVLRRQEALL